MTVLVERIRQDIEAIGKCTETPARDAGALGEGVSVGGGVTRPTFSEAWGVARDYVITEVEKVGGEVKVDAAGNVRGRLKGLGWEKSAWLVGSHIDSVPRGGDYDGVIGVVLALELMRSAVEEGVDDLPVELVIFAEEEGPTFGLGMLGSRSWVDELEVEHLKELKNAAGESFFEAGAKYGVDEAGLEALQFDASAYAGRGMIELHIEQGPGMWRRDQRLALVPAIAGRQQYRVTVTGEANHAGATAMGDRKDALAAASAMVLAAEALAKELGNDSVMTVGRLEAKPNAVNVIADRVVFTVDFRSPENALLSQGEVLMEERFGKIAAERDVEVAVEVTEMIAATAMDLGVLNGLRSAARVCGVNDLPEVPSGALHDAAVMAPYLPTAMLFVPSRDGISHNPAEFSRVEDVAAAAEVVEQLVRRPDLAKLQAMTQEEFVKVCGGWFEHSPWVAERGWGVLQEQGSVGTVDELQAVLVQVVADASEDEQLALIRAHPDLVGKLAKAGQLTAESTTEQQAAGLMDLSVAEAEQFDTFNSAYQAKFGFPFVICARENKKEAILEAFPIRLEHEAAIERETALKEIAKIAKLRMIDTVWVCV